MSKRDQAIIAQLYRMVQSLRGGDDLPIVCENMVLRWTGCLVI